MKYISFKRIAQLAIAFCVLWISLVNANAMPYVMKEKFIAGICTHLTTNNRPIERTLNMLAAAGATSLRDDATWAAVEKKKGMLHIPSRWDKLVNEALKRHIAPLLILDYGNRFYDGGSKPLTRDGIAAFARYAELVVSHFKGRVVRYEIWNEWEQNIGHTKAGTPSDYVRLVRTVYPLLKKIDPKAEFLVGAVSADGIRSGYLDKIIKLGVLNFADALSLHAYVYRQTKFSDASSWALWMKNIESELTGIQGEPVPFYITEIGWPTNYGKNGVSEKKQAKYLSNVFFLAHQMPFIKGIWWYDFQNDGLDPFNIEDNFGLVRQDFSEKPAYRAFKQMNKIK